jgi:(1->4)-alpha-D-glucan 1-alpha-D-glucosylmutase
MFRPSSTYRVQLNDHFTLRDLRALLPYLHDLGISTIYASPLTTATRGSQHGYDVADPLTLSPEIGTEEEWEQLTAALRQYGLTWIQDIVPNHMAWHSCNPWLFDVLQRGPDSLYYRWFDIITGLPAGPVGDRLMAPFLGDTLSNCLQKGELNLQFTPGGFVIRYYDNEYPLAVRLYRRVLAEGCPPALLSSLHRLEEAIPSDPATWKRTMDDWLQDVQSNAGWREFIAGRTELANTQPGVLEALLQDQPYAFTHYRLAASYINYRRFFTVNSLICLRMEEEAVFDAWHKTIYGWHKKGRINGLRVDHIDGLADPRGYLRRLRQLFGSESYIIVEKILSQGEALPADWPVQGTTGYDFLADVNQLLTDDGGNRELLTFYKGQVASIPSFEELVYRRKLDYLRRQMGGEWNNLLHLLTCLPLLYGAQQDKDRLKQALGVWMASFPTYRAYPDADGQSPDDYRMFGTSLDRARQREPDLEPELNYFANLCELDDPRLDAPAREQRVFFLRRLMQFTGPLAAKGIEDTSFYVYNPYIAQCEVGDSPAIAGIGVLEFHRRMLERQRHQPHSLNATTTHDTKRGEDARIRLHYLSSTPREWITAVSGWRQANGGFIAEAGGRRAPSPNDEYLIYQALLGAWPVDGGVTDEFRGRFATYLTKALREAKTETDYDEPDEAYEGQCQAFATAILQDGSSFRAAFTPFALDVIRRSAPYSLSQALLKVAAPGVPDIYQGAELWDTSLVDPDNRRPVDYTRRSRLLTELKAAEAGGPSAALAYARDHWDEGAEKLYTLYHALACRNRLPKVFADGAYIPLVTEGPLLAWLRRYDRDWVLAAVPLIRYRTSFPAPVTIALPPDAPLSWNEVFTGETLVASPLLSWPQGLAAWPVVLATAR